jgi:hypothetical protein
MAFESVPFLVFFALFFTAYCLLAPWARGHNPLLRTPATPPDLHSPTLTLLNAEGRRAFTRELAVLLHER